jgi:segregation and condensation protein A
LDYRVELDVFNGPLDLLLYLIKRDELDIYDIPIARITDSYIQYVRRLKDMSREHGLDINVAGDFMVMAATLMEIKSAMLLPRQEPTATKDGERSTADELADPRLGLVRQLLEYKRIKDQATLLDRQKHDHEARFPRVPVLPEIDTDEPPPLDMDEVQIWDLLDAFSRLMRDIGGGLKKSRFHEVAYDDTPIELHEADIEDRVRREKKVSLRTLMEGRQTRSEMIGVFLALLELIRQKKILIHQNPDDALDMEIEDAPEEHRRTFLGTSAENHLARFENPPSPSQVEAHDEADTPASES